jgi:glycosyltransferase involved in cell wall biosynthesis
VRALIISNLCPPYYLGGYEIACLNVASALVRRGHEVHLATTPSHIPGHPDPSYVDRCLDLRFYDPYELPGASLDQALLHDATCSNYANTAAIIRLLREFDPDVVYCWNVIGIGGLAIFDILNIIGVPWVLHLMDTIPADLSDTSPVRVRHIFNGGGSALYARAKLISMSGHILDLIHDRSGIRFEQGVEIIPGWVDTNGVEVRRSYQSGGFTRFVTAGAIRHNKGFGLIEEAAAALVARGVVEFQIDIFGDGLVSHYVDMAKRLGVADRVHFLGERPQSKLLQCYKDYDVFLFPTWEQEPFGFAPIEAAACGCVPIITRNCGVSERLVDGVHCLKIDHDMDDLARAMRAVIRGEVDLLRIGAAGAALVHTDLSFDHIIDKIESILSSACTGWDRTTLRSKKVKLLAYVKHHLSRILRFQTES